MFEVRNGNFAYNEDRQILQDISFKIDENEILSILGANGVGKTTLIKCMLGLQKWHSGESLFQNENLANKKDIWKQIGYVPQRKHSSFNYTVKEMITLGRTAHLGLFSLPNENDKKIVDDVMEMIGVTRFKDKLCSRISGGELQMVLIGRALALQPKLLILDEPESNLDFRNQRIVLNLIKNLKSDFNISSILNTHFPEHAMAISDSVLLLRRELKPIFGKTEDILTEENLRETFDINVYIRKVGIDTGDYSCVIAGELL